MDDRWSANRSPSERVLVIGLDGATFDVLTPLVELGVMQNLGRLMQNAALAELNSTRPFITPAAWSTFQTGCDPQQHGIWDYRYFDHVRGRLQLNHSGRLLRPTLFDAVSQAGGEVVSINLPMTFPSPIDVRGIVIGGIDAPSVSAALAPYPEFAKRLRSACANFELKTIWKRRPSTWDELSTGVDRTIADFHSRSIAAAIADEMTDWRLMVVQFQTLDCLQHRCWEWLNARACSETPSAGAEESPDPTWVVEVQRAMRALDQAIGEVCDLAERRNASIMVVSDHGFGAFRAKINVLELLRNRGLVVPLTTVNRGRYLAAHLAWKARRWAAGRRRNGSSTAALARSPMALAPIDWRKSQTVVMHGDLAGMVYLNSQDRFPAGPISAASQRDQTTADVVAAFREATHTETGEPLFDQVIDTRARFDCDPVERQWPDVVAVPAAGFHTRTKLDAPGELLRDDPFMNGTHRTNGVFMLKARGIAPAHHTPPELRDVAPTILNMLGIRPIQPMTGRALTEILSTETITTAPEQVLSAAVSSGPCVYNDAETEAVEARLRDLGYLD